MKLGGFETILEHGNLRFGKFGLGLTIERQGSRNLATSLSADCQRLTFVAEVASPDSVRLYRAIVAEADRMPGLGRLFWEAGRRQVRTVIAQLWADTHDTATAPIVADQLVKLSLGDAY